MLNLYYSGHVLAFGKDAFIVNEKPFDQKQFAKFSEDVLIGKDFVFVQAEIEASETIKMYMKKTGRKTIKWIKKLCDAMNAKKIL